MAMRAMLRIMALAAVLGLAACADGGAIIAEGDPCGVGAPTIASENGIWISVANFLDPPGGAITSAVLATLFEGELSMVRLDTSGGINPFLTPIVVNFYAGQYGQAGSGSVRVYNAIGQAVATQPLIISRARTLNVSVGGQLIAFCPLSGGVQPLYNRPSITEDGTNLVVGRWRYIVPPNPPAFPNEYRLDYDLGTTGALTGNDTTNCFYSGQWTDPDTNRNLYRIANLSLSAIPPGNCDGGDDEVVFSFIGSGYIGYAFILPGNPDNLWSVVANDDAAYFVPFTRDSAAPGPPVGEDDEIP